MSLVYFNGGNGETETTALIKEKTGLELIYGNASGSGIYSCQLKFPDMEDYVELTMMKPASNESGLCFVDVENHFFAYVEPKTDMNYYRPSEQINNWLFILIYEKNGKLVSEITSKASENMHMYEFCNITQYASNTSKEQITLVPLYTEFGKSFVKNTYINYERMFQPGLKFVDENGNEFITLGSYLLYKNN